MEPTPPPEPTAETRERSEEIPQTSVLPRTLEESQIMVAEYKASPDDERMIEEQKIGYTFWLESLDRQVEKGIMDPKTRNKIIANMLTAKDLLLEHLYRESKTDRNTLLPNKAAYKEMVEKLIAANKKFGVLWLDLDHFKQVNDTLGHLAGDQTLRGVARILRSSIRHSDVQMPQSVRNPRKDVATLDVATRTGGEEFSIILEGVETDEQVAQAGERILSAIRTHVFEVTDNSRQRRELKIAASIGGSVYEKGTFEEFELEGDEKLYRAKDGGRNQ